MKNSKIILISLTATVVTLLVVTTLSFTSRPRIAYVQVAEIYNDFQMQKEMQKELDHVQQARKLIIDSLGLSLNIMSQHLGEEARYDTAFLIRQNDLAIRNRQFEQDNMATAQRYQEQIWKQLNQYIGDYGREKNYTYILGTDGTGAVMYANQAENITEEVKAYVNSRYQDKK